MEAHQDWIDTDFYSVLGVAETASDAEIKRAYKKLLRDLHPDRNPGDAAAEERFKAVSRAKEVLADPATRKQYDEFRRAVRQRGAAFAGNGAGRNAAGGPFGGYGPGGFGPDGSTVFTFTTDDLGDADLSDLLGGFFAPGGGPRTGRAAGPRPRQARRGADVNAHLTLDFEDAARGIETALTIGDRQVKTRIPAGVNDGQTIRLRGKGQPGFEGAPAGDLLIDISVAAHPRFGRTGNDLTITVPVTYTEAVLGGEIDVPTLEGAPVKVRVPAGTRNGRTLRVRGRGISGGDLLVTVEVAVPSHVTGREKELLEELARIEASRPSPRAQL